MKLKILEKKMVDEQNSGRTFAQIVFGLTLHSALNPLVADGLFINTEILGALVCPIIY